MKKNFNNDWNDIKRGIEAVCNKFPDLIGKIWTIVGLIQ